LEKNNNDKMMTEHSGAQYKTHLCNSVTYKPQWILEKI